MRRAMRRNWEMMQEMRRMQERSGEGGDRGGSTADDPVAAARIVAVAATVSVATADGRGDGGRDES